MAKSKGFGKNLKAERSNRSNSSESIRSKQSNPGITAETLALALRYFQSGQLAEAEQLYRQILQQQPKQPEALHGLGVTVYQSGRWDEALSYLQRSLTLNPTDANAHNSLGVMWKERGDLEQATLHLRRAIALNPNHFSAYVNLADALQTQGDWQNAVDCFRTALALNPNDPPTHHNLGLALREQGNLQEAATCLQRSLALNPNDAEVHNSLGVVFQELDQWEAAVDSYRQAVALRPDYVIAHTNLGNMLRELGQLDEASLHLRSALALQPNNAVAHDVLGVVLMEQGKFEQAKTHLQQAISLDFDRADTYYNLALTLLTLGDLRNGFAEHEWRWQTKNWRPGSFPQPLWDGSNLGGKTIMLHAEQGLGDTIQFIRYVSLVKDRGGRVVVACQPPLRRLLEAVSGIEQVMVPDEPLLEFQVQAPLMSLPYLFGTTLETIHAKVPYLTAPTDGTPRLGLLPDTRLKVGLVWAGGHRGDNRRLSRFYERKSCPLSLYAKLLSIPEISFYSLQVGHNSGDISALDANYPLQDLSSEIKDFADTAALITQMDLVISVDTAVAHLAGALGKPVWVLLPFVADWRWLRERQDSPWYPTMRLFRQQFPGDWHSVLNQIAEALKKLVDGVLEPEFDLAPISQEVSPLRNTTDTDNDLGLVLIQQGKLEAAATHFRRIVALNPDNALAYVNLGNVLREQSKLEEAIVNFQKALALNSDDAYTQAYAHNSYGTALLDQGAPETAASHFREAIALRPSNVLPYVNLGNVLREQGNLEEAIVNFQKAVDLNPNYAIAS
jgi:tetratricopeptide (TPR) repeat protein